MGSVNNPNPWAPYANYKDCVQGICSIYCPQWCYTIFPPPPPLGLSDDNSGADFSPLIIAVIGILASAFLLVCYYTIISKYCRRSRGDDNTSGDFDQNRDEMNHDQAWQVAHTGLDDEVIKSITVCKYKKGDGLVEGTDCSVCLNEFEDDESLRLLPKCNHAFHLPCIDTWLKSHSSCPLCRSNIASFNSLTHPIPEARPNINISALEYQQRNDTLLVVHDLESVQPVTIVSLVHGDEEDSKERDNIIEIRQFRRSVSLDSSSSSRQGHLSIADILGISQSQMENHQFSSGEYGESNNGLHLVMERSTSTGRFMFSRNGKGKNYIIPN